MSEDKYLYGVSSGYLGVEVERTKIIKETKKTIKVEQYIDPYSIIMVYKNSPDLARTPDKAIEIFIHNHSASIEQLKIRIESLELEIAKAKLLWE